MSDKPWFRVALSPGVAEFLIAAGATRGETMSADVEPKPRERLIYPCPTPGCETDLGSPFGMCRNPECRRADIVATVIAERWFD